MYKYFCTQCGKKTSKQFCGSGSVIIRYFFLDPYKESNLFVSDLDADQQVKGRIQNFGISKPNTDLKKKHTGSETLIKREIVTVAASRWAATTTSRSRLSSSSITLHREGKGPRSCVQELFQPTQSYVFIVVVVMGCLTLRQVCEYQCAIFHHNNHPTAL